MLSGKKKGLGKGLGALIAPMDDPVHAPPAFAAGAENAEPIDQVLQLDPQTIEPNPRQPRSVFNEEALQELAESIRRDGVQEPVIVRKVGDVYQLVSGERRVRASIMADRERIPAVCRDISDADMLKFGLIENIQREDLNAIELAVGYKALMEECGWTQEEMAAQVGKNRVTVTNTLRLLNLIPEVQSRLAEGAITMGHARALLAITSPDAQRAACRKVIAQGLSVRETEKLAAPPAPSEKKSAPKDANIQGIEDELRRKLGTRVNVRVSQKNRGKFEIEYFNLDDFERILDILRSASGIKTL